MPTGHGLQAANDLDPNSALNVPAGHSLHLLTPGNSEYVPGLQGSHKAERTALKVPVGQRLQTDGDVAPVTLLKVPDEQESHRGERAVRPYDPPSQRTQAAEPSGENCPAGQALQSEALLEPTTELKVPAAHDTQALALSMVEKVPGVQFRQSLPEMKVPGLHCCAAQGASSRENATAMAQTRRWRRVRMVAAGEVWKGSSCHGCG